MDFATSMRLTMRASWCTMMFILWTFLGSVMSFILLIVIAGALGADANTVVSYIVPAGGLLIGTAMACNSWQISAKKHEIKMMEREVIEMDAQMSHRSTAGRSIPAR